MDTFKIQVNGKTYTTSKITVSNSREAIKINAEILELTKAPEEEPTIVITEDMTEEIIQEIMKKNVEIVTENAENAITIYSKLDQLLIRQLTLIRSIYADQFTIDDLQNSFSRAELEAEINNIMRGVSGILAKN